MSVYAKKLEQFKKINPEFITDNNHTANRSNIRWQFPNGWGASVTCHAMSYGGEPEFAVLKDNQLNYSSGITEDVISHITVHEFALHLARLRGM